MKARNNQEINLGYTKFAFGILGSVTLAVLLMIGFIATSKTEIARIESKTAEYDGIYAKQTQLVERMDSLYNYMMLLNSSKRINNVVLLQLIGNRKVNFAKEIGKLAPPDGKIYKRLSDQFGGFLLLKDSIRIKSIEKTLVENDLQRCIMDNRKAVRKLSLGNTIIER